MYLKALEIQGFKSFPQKTRLTFEKAVTAIVGPNGSGKSNIADALRWVMGEQSTRTLRGGKMEDVIFGGTEKRGQIGFAEVSLILDNSEHLFDMENSEVMITRRYYRSGDSEYYINRQAVRLKDINELFMDTGLGREGYSIIGQGRIDEILSVRSADRRDIFEEAAGISRFRHRKEESEHKLERAEENLVRVNDKIVELEMQVIPLREQAETAKKYLVLRDELRGLEISVWLENLTSVAAQAKKLSEDGTQARAQLDRANRELEELYKAGEEFSEKVRAKDVESESVRERISAQESRNAELDSASAVLRANLRGNMENIQRITGELAQQEGRDTGIRSQIEERASRIENIIAERERLTAQTDELSRRLDDIVKSAGEAYEELAGLTRRESENVERLSESRVRLSSLAASLQELEDRDSSLLSEMSQADEHLESAREDEKKNTLELRKTREERESLKNVISGYNIRVASRRKKAETAKDKKIRLTMEAGALRSRISLLTEMEKEYEGYSKSVKIVMQESARGILRNIHGPVADLVRTDDKYALAVETAFGGAMQNIIVGSEEDGKAAINLLKRRDGGRATFLPISAIKGTRLRENGLENEDGFQGLAIDLIRYDEKYREIYTNLLGRIAVVEDMDCAIRIARRYGYRFRVVTMDGQVINAGGSMTGGSTSKSAGILSRANELTKLAEQEKLLGEDSKKADRENEEAGRELAAAEYELTVAADELRSLEDSVLKLEAAAGHHRVLITAMEESRKSLKEEATGIRQRIENSTRDIADVKVSITALEKAAAEIKEEAQQKSEGCEQLTRLRQEILDSQAELRTADASLAAEGDALSKAVSELTALRSELSGGRENQLRIIDDLKQQNEQIKAEITEKEMSITAAGANILAARKRLAEIAEEKLALEGERTKRDKLTQDRNREILDLERECGRLEQKKIAADMEEKQIIDKLWDTYELSRSAAMGVKLELESIPAAMRRVGELKRDIAKLGNPNIGAIEEFERVNTRYTYLTEQRDDIDKAKSELLGIIRDITNQMKTIFSGEFTKINESFMKTFSEMFGGGHASLELDDPEDVLNCGIEIKVQPPGKTLKILSLLSGGEKAFVAIALYFAILKVRPTPFVVMDEIEAALDEVNVQRFADYMRLMTDRTQFLVITHRRGTMEEADVLYGVTMQEQGVSQVLNIDLDEAENAMR